MSWLITGPTKLVKGSDYKMSESIYTDTEDDPFPTNEEGYSSYVNQLLDLDKKVFMRGVTTSPDLRIVVDDEYITGALQGSLALRYQSLILERGGNVYALEQRVQDSMSLLAKSHSTGEEYDDSMAMFNNHKSFILFGPRLTNYAMLLGNAQGLNSGLDQDMVSEIPFSSRFECDETRDIQLRVLLGGLSMMISCVNNPGLLEEA
jgi:hypothetical protein